jgi:hypothetical protein
MYIRLLFLIGFLGINAGVHAQSLGFLNQDSPHDSLRKPDRFPVFPAIHATPITGSFKRLIPLMDMGFQAENPVQGKLRGGLHIDLEKSMFFMRFSSFIGLYSNHSIFNANGVNILKPSLFQVDPGVRLGIKPSKYFNAQIGFDRNFYGEGARSLFLSDFGKPYPFISTRFNVGPLNYQAMLAYLWNNSGQNKFQTTHFFNCSIGKKIDLQFFESVVFNSGDTITYRSFDPSYLNPFMVIRPQEYAIGSGDNVLIGLGASFRLSTNIKLYGQFMLDDFLLSALLNKSQYWGNKYAGQLGIKCRGLRNKIKYQWRIEVNAARPYTYAHLGDALSYTHASQVLAHPLGANFKEVFSQFKIAKNAWTFLGEFSIGSQGIDTSAINYGSNIFLPYTSRPFDVGVVLLQGNKTTFLKSRFSLSFTFKSLNFTELFGELFLIYSRNKNLTHVTFTPTIGIRSPIFNDYRF